MAAAYHSLLVGTALFKSEWLMNQILKAARAGTSEFLLRPSQEVRRNKEPLNPPPPLQATKRSQKDELERLCSLQVGQKVWVY